MNPQRRSSARDDRARVRGSAFRRRPSRSRRRCGGASGRGRRSARSSWPSSRRPSRRTIPDIKLVPVDSPFTGFHDRAIVLHQAKKLPDVLLAQVDWIAEFADLGMLEPLDERIAKEPKEFFDNIPATFHQKWRGKQYYLPIESGAVALFYNTDLFKAAEIAGPPKTWAEFAEISRKLTNPEKTDLRRHRDAAGRAADQHDLRHLPAPAPGGREDHRRGREQGRVQQPGGRRRHRVAMSSASTRTRSAFPACSATARRRSGRISPPATSR